MGFPKLCYEIDSPILLQEPTSKYYGETFLLSENQKQ